MPQQGVVVPVGGVELVVHAQRQRDARERPVQTPERMPGFRGRRVADVPRPDRPQSGAEDVHQRVQKVHRSGGVDEQGGLTLPQLPCSSKESAHRFDMAVMGVDPVLHAVLPGHAQALGELRQMQRVFLEHVHTAPHECLREFGARAAGDRRADRDAGDVDVLREGV